MQAAAEEDWTRPLAGACPAGPCLEYDSAYAALQARMRPSQEVQYGSFSLRREGPPWPELERECRALLERSRDITVLVWWLRCRVRTAGADGFEQGLRTMLGVLRSLGASIHPQAQVDGRHEPAIRAKALALLGDPEALLADLREMVALRGLGRQRRLRDVEREALADAAARQALQHDLWQAREAGDAGCLSLQRAQRELTGLLEWARRDLGEHMPDLSALQRLLHPFGSIGSPEVAATDDACADADAHADPAAAPGPPREPGAVGGIEPTLLPGPQAPPAAPPAVLQDRADALACIGEARAWFEFHEPSSPVGVLLRQAERLVGRRYADVAQAIPPELLARWESSS